MTIKKEEVTKTEIITKYIAADGTTFHTQTECELYEKSALCAVKKTLKKLHTKDLSEYDIFGTGSEECYVEIYDIKTAEDLVRLRMYCDLESKGQGNLNTLDKISVGHEVVIFWNYDRDWYWTKGNGSIKGILNSIKEQLEYAMSLPEADINDTVHTSN